MGIVLNNIPIECGIADSNVKRLLYYPGFAKILPPFDVEAPRCGMVSSLGAVCTDRRGLLQVFFHPLPQGPSCFPYVFLIGGKFPTHVHVDSSTFHVYSILIFGFD